MKKKILLLFFCTPLITFSMSWYPDSDEEWEAVQAAMDHHDAVRLRQAASQWAALSSSDFSSEEDDKQPEADYGFLPWTSDWIPVQSVTTGDSRYTQKEYQIAFPLSSEITFDRKSPKPKMPRKPKRPSQRERKRLQQQLLLAAASQ